VKKYEGLFILNVSNKEEEIKEAIDNIAKEIVALGGKVEAVQRLERHTFARAKNKKVTSGYYVNFVFTCAPSVIEQLRNKFALKEEIFRVMFTIAPEKKAEEAKLAEAKA